MTNRRGFIKQLAISGVGLSLSNTGMAFSPRDSSFSFLHLTDSHVRRKRMGHKGFETCVEKVNGLEPRPDFILYGGDQVFDGMYTEKEEYKDQLYVFSEVSKKLEIPAYHCIGNHDVFGRSARRKTSPDDPDIGKKNVHGCIRHEETLL